MKRILSTLLALCMALSLLPATATAAGVDVKFDGGNGTADAPFQISTAEQLKEFATLVNNGSESLCAELTDDIHLGNEPWTPIGVNNSFTGTFDGDGNTITGLYINIEDGSVNNGGVFGWVGTGGAVKNLTVGGSVTIKSNEPNYDGNSPTGGVAGTNNGTVENCHSFVSVTSSGHSVGGVVGVNGGTVKNCSKTGGVESTMINGSGTVGIGGVVGYNTGSVINCYNTGDVSAQSTWNVGGVVGGNFSGATVANCYDTGGVTGLGSVGCVVGNNDILGNGEVGTGENCYYIENTRLKGIGSDEEDSGATSSMKDDQFASGEVTWLLQKDRTSPHVWGQTLGSDKYPILTSDEDKWVYKITYDYRYASHNNKDEYKNNFFVPETPDREGYSFGGWFMDDEFTDKYSTETRVSGDKTLYAKWKMVYEINFQPSENGTVSADATGAAAGDKITVTVELPEGYELESLACASDNGESVEIMKNDDGTYIFIMPDASVTVTARFKAINYNVKVEQTENGAVTADRDTAIIGDRITLTVKPEEGCQLVAGSLTVTKDGDGTISTSGGGDTYTFIMPASDVTVTAEFEKIPDTSDAPDPPDTTHTHTWSAEWASNSTHHWHECTEDCYITSDSGKDGYAPHTAGDWIIDQAATSTTAGHRYKECTDCLLIMEDETIPATGGDSYNEGSYNEDNYNEDCYTSDDTSYQITVLAANNGTVTAPKSALSGTKVTITVTPDNGYAVGSVTVMNSSTGRSVSVTDNGDGTYTFTMPSSRVTVSATFALAEEKSEEGPTEEEPRTNPFTDVSEGDWFYEYVAFVKRNSLMEGVGNGQFAPGGTTTRGMIMTILARMAGVDTSGGDPWYQTGMEWAVSAGVSDGTGPEMEITREQFATMLWRYAGEPKVTGNLNTYPDTDQICDWADDAMVWAVENSIIEGTDDGRLDPQGNALRSQAAAMLTRFCRNIVK